MVFQSTHFKRLALGEVHERELGSVPQLVAEEPVALYAQDVQVQVPTLGHGAEGKPDDKIQSSKFTF